MHMHNEFTHFTIFLSKLNHYFLKSEAWLYIGKLLFEKKYGINMDLFWNSVKQNLGKAQTKRASPINIMITY